MQVKNPVVGIILDGVGVRKEEEGNAVFSAKMPFFNSLLQSYPNRTIEASGECVGLPNGQMGNSEVGHLNLGAGRVVYQDLLRINNAIKDKSLDKNKVLQQMFDRVKQKNSTLHIVGLVSNGGVHSHIEHLKYILKLAKKNGISKVLVHCITDGRDTRTNVGVQFVSQIEVLLSELNIGSIATVIGRFYAMDREDRWTRTKTAYQLITFGEGIRASCINTVFSKAYERKVSDEYVPAFVLGNYQGLQDGDEMFFFNFRPDRMRQLTHAFTENRFLCFNRGKLPQINCTAMCMYDAKQDNLPYLFGPEVPPNTLSQVISKLNLKQLKLAESTKYAHVTYFFNGTVEKPYKGEKRILIESKDIESFAEFPQMRAQEIAETAVKEIKSNNYDLIIINFSNGDMVGHTGNFDATVTAMGAVDQALTMVVESAQENGYTCIITADHGNAEDMRESSGCKTTHTCNPVPFIVTDNKVKLKNGKEYALDCFAPTVLQLMDLYKPMEMTGTSIIGEIKGK